MTHSDCSDGDTTSVQGEETDDTFDNPYFETVAGSGVTVGANRESWSEAAVDLLSIRDQLVEEYAWAIPNTDAIELLVDHEPILEVGAGTGYWAWCVEQLGGEIAATEPNPPTADGYTDRIMYDAVEAIKTVRVSDVEQHTLFMCWPGYQSDWPSGALDEYRGNTFVFVGEGRGGRTGSDQFHEQLWTDWTLDVTVDIPTYLGFLDRMEVWVR